MAKINKISAVFRIETLSGGKLIIMECPGYESEGFVPQIINNRLTLTNVIEDRRCCKQNLNSSSRILQSTNENAERLPKKCIERVRPLANSTPTKIFQSSKENLSPVQRFPTPDIVRRAVVQNNNASVQSFAPGIKVVRLHRAPTPNTPSKLARIHRPRIQSPQTISACARQTQILRNLSNVSMFRSPPALSTTNKSSVAKSPNCSFLLRKINTPRSVTKWRKCITPQRTYIRSSIGQKKKTPLKVEHVKPMPLGKNGKALLDFQLNPTKYPSGEGSVVIRRRKLIIDNKLTIDPKEFKQQLKYTADLKRASNFQLPKNRRQYIALQQTAFDLLTNSCYHPRASNQLNELFREGCLHKRADTILKYRQLIEDIPKLETL